MKSTAFWSAFIIVLTLIIFPEAQVVADEVSQKRAFAAAETWLKLVDGGEYDKSWETAAELFKTGVDKDQWSKTVGAVRGPLGKVLQRKIKSKQFMTSLPGVPDGKYVVIQYDTSFENKRAATETITPMLDKDGKWRVSGYYIR